MKKYLILLILPFLFSCEKKEVEPGDQKEPSPYRKVRIMTTLESVYSYKYEFIVNGETIERSESDIDQGKAYFDILAEPGDTFEFTVIYENVPDARYRYDYRIDTDPYEEGIHIDYEISEFDTFKQGEVIGFSVPME